MFKFGLLLCIALQLLPAKNASAPGDAFSPYPTFVNLSIEWEIQGDDNNNGEVTVRYRRTGDKQWRAGLPLHYCPKRVENGTVYPQMYKGSLLDLESDTKYEVELALQDPDGGSIVKTISAKTKKYPEKIIYAPVVKVRSAGSLPLAKQQAGPGNILLFAPGTYHNLVIEKDGTPDRPIVIRSDGLHKAVIYGRVNLMGRKHVYLEGFTINGGVRVDNSEGLVIRDCKIYADSFGIAALVGPAENSLITDNIILGLTAPSNTRRLVTGSVEWNVFCLGNNGDNHGTFWGLKGFTNGGEISFNDITGCRDCYSFVGKNASDIDIFNNDFDICCDDGIEIDYAFGNIRLLRNRFTNFHAGISAAPLDPGPGYYIRNVFYNGTGSAFKWQRGSFGNYAYHNTIVKCASGNGFGGGPFTAKQRNNIFIGGRSGGNSKTRVVNFSDRVVRAPCEVNADFNYNAYGSIDTSFVGKICDVFVYSIEELREKSTEKNAIEIDMNVFSSGMLYPCADTSWEFPFKKRQDFRIKTTAAVVNKGEIVPGINDAGSSNPFRGTAPDIGAYEVGDPPITYGPKGSSVFGINLNSYNNLISEPFSVSTDNVAKTLLIGFGVLEKPVEIKVYNIFGRIITKMTAENQKVNRISTKRFSPGLYFVKANRGSKQLIKKIVIMQ